MAVDFQSHPAPVSGAVFTGVAGPPAVPGGPRGLGAPAAAADASPRRRPRRSLADPEYRAGLRYLVFGRAFPAVLFGFMGWLQLNRLMAVLPPASVNDLIDTTLPRSLYLTFCALPVVIYVCRPRPAARDGRLVARAAAFGGTLMQLVVGTFAPDSGQVIAPPSWVGPLSAVLFIAAWAYAVWGLAYLRRSLSIIPEARRLTTSGPYRLVRHPLYFAEITAAVAVTIVGMKAIPLIALALFISLQLVRARFEEQLLRSVFPEYAAYARRTPRLIPVPRLRRRPAAAG